MLTNANKSRDEFLAVWTLFLPVHVSAVGCADCIDTALNSAHCVMQWDIINVITYRSCLWSALFCSARALKALSFPHPQFIKPSHTFCRSLQWPACASASRSWTRRSGAAKDGATCSTSWHTARRALIKSSWKCRLFLPSLHTHSLTSRCSRKLKACTDITAAVSSVLSCPVTYTKTREDGWVVALYMWWHTDGTLSTLKEVNKYQIAAGRHNAASLISLTHYFDQLWAKKITAHVSWAQEDRLND